MKRGKSSDVSIKSYTKTTLGKEVNKGRRGERRGYREEEGK